MNQRNYYLHVRFSKIFERKINTVKKLLIKYNSINDTMPAHITISYGPKIDYDITKDPALYEIKNIKEFDTIYPGFLKKFKNKIPDIKYIGVTPFLRLDNIVIKIEVESKILLDMVKYCRLHIQSYNETIKLWKINYNNSKKELKKKYSTIFTPEHSFNKNPKGALHITLITLKPDTPEYIIIDIIKYAENMLAKMGITKGYHIKPDRIDLKTPITKQFIDVFNF